MAHPAFEEILFSAEEHFEKCLTSLGNDFGRIRTGRAAPQMLDHVMVLAYGTPMPLRQLASITVPEPAQLLVKAFDRGQLHAIEKALSTADLGMQPVNDGLVIRLNLPPLSQERRKQLAIQAKEVAEKAKVAMRNVRRDVLKSIESTGKDQRVSEDEVKKAGEEITETLHNYEAKVEKQLKDKQAAITEI
jgi:ribosome recycling factor